MDEAQAMLFSTPFMRTIFAPEAHVRAMLTFEAALARAEARAGIIPSAAAEAIAAQCQSELFDINALYREAVHAGTPAIPLVRMLTVRVEGEAQRYVHWGATSQDVIDSALMLQIRSGLDLLINDLLAICASCAQLAEQHRHTPMAGRTLLQQALPISFGLKAARWLAMLTRLLSELRAIRTHGLVVQFGGAAGTLASLGDKGLIVASLLAEELHLTLPDLPWHTERDRIGLLAGTLGTLAGALAKIANDVVHLAQNEVGEVTEEAVAGKGGSSAMPQKRNPVDATRALAAARLAIGFVPTVLAAMVQEHERAVGGWQAEWAAMPDLFGYCAGAADGVRATLAGLQVNTERMRENLALGGSLMMSEALTMALALHMGRPAAYRLVQTLGQRVIAGEGDLQQIAQTDAHVRAFLSAEEVERVLEPTNYLGSTDILIDRALAAYRAMHEET